jgi:hypothetical protein
MPVNVPSMSRDAADQVLAGLGAAHDRIAAAMFALDSNPALGFLRGGGLTGATATRWQTLSSEVDLLWAHFTVLNEALEQARAIRTANRPGDPQWTELGLLLQEPTIGLNSAGLPADGSSPPATWVRLWDLAQQLERRCTAAAAFLCEVDSAWSAVAGRLGPVGEALDAATALAAELGVPADVGPAAARFADVHQALLADPISAAPGGRLGAEADAAVREVAAGVDAARRRLADMARLREEFPRRVEALRRLADDVAAAERETADTFTRVAGKILAPNLPAPPSAAAALHATAEGLDQLGRGAGWGRLADGIVAAEQAALRAGQRAAELRDNAEGLIARRDELRGRLDAYRAKAASKGLGEHSELSAQYDAAHALLFTAPCDLRGATRATVAYQQTLNTLLEEQS